MLVTFQCASAADRGIIATAKAVKQQMRTAAYDDYLHQAALRREVKVWPASVQIVRRLNASYNRADAVVYNAQVRMNRIHLACWYFCHATDEYHDAQIAQRKWLELRDHITARLKLIASKTDYQGTTAAVEFERAKRQWDLSFPQYLIAYKINYYVNAYFKTTTYDEDARVTLAAEDAERNWALNVFLEMRDYLARISEPKARKRLNAKYKEADAYLAERVAYYNTLVEAETEEEEATEAANVLKAMEALRAMENIEQLRKLMSGN
jgi:hypothetical protein